jgi:hypothetical protein
MRREVFGAMVGVTALLFCFALAYPQSRNSGWGQWGYRPLPTNRPWNYCPQCGTTWGPYGGYGMDPQGRWRSDYGVQPQEKGRENRTEPNAAHNQNQYGTYSPEYSSPPYQKRPGTLLDEKEAEGITEGYLNAVGNPNLKLGKMEKKDDVFEAEIVTKEEGSLVDKVIINRKTGQLRSIY